MDAKQKVDAAIKQLRAEGHAVEARIPAASSSFRSSRL